MEMKEKPSVPDMFGPEEAPVDAEQEGTTSDDSVEAAPAVTMQAMSVDELRAELDVQRQKTQEHLDHLQRLQAEFSNYRRRVAQEKAQAASHGKAEVLVSLLPILGNLRLALQHADQDAKAVHQGVQMIWQQCEEFLRNQGVEPIATVGQLFDPAQHEALSTVPATDETPANTIVAEINSGYMLNGHLLRAAQVVVARAAEGDTSSPTEPSDTPPEAAAPAC